MRNIRKAIVAAMVCLCATAAMAQKNTYRSKGYKGNIEIGASNAGISVMTTHGYQFNRFLFVGGGMGYEADLIPLYADVKSYFTKKEMKVNPWAEVRLGFQMIEGLYPYFSPAVGFTVPVGKDLAISAALQFGLTDYEQVITGFRVGFQF